MFYHALTGNGGTTPTENLEPVLLWENSNPTVAFTPQKVTLDLTNYAGVIIELIQSTTLNVLRSRVYYKKTDNFAKLLGSGFRGEEGNSYARNILMIDNTGVQFGNDGSDNQIVIPYRIYGVKSYVVEPVNNLQLITTSPNKTATFTAEDNVNYLVIESAYNGSGAVSIRDCSVDNGELVVLKHAVGTKLETYTALIKNAVGTVNYSSAATSDEAMILIFKLVG